MKVEIDLRTWGRGRYSKGYLHQDGKRCCLGFLGLACGATDEGMDFIELPSALDGPDWPRELLRSSTHTTRSGRINLLEDVLAAINDAEKIDDATRRAWIEEGFRHLTAPDGTKCEVVWVGDELERSEA